MKKNRYLNGLILPYNSPIPYLSYIRGEQYDDCYYVCTLGNLNLDDDIFKVLGLHLEFEYIDERGLNFIIIPRLL